MSYISEERADLPAFSLTNLTMAGTRRSEVGCDAHDLRPDEAAWHLMAGVGCYSGDRQYASEPLGAVAGNDKARAWHRVGSPFASLVIEEKWYRDRRDMPPLS